jgi:hypothetical protein
MSDDCPPNPPLPNLSQPPDFLTNPCPGPICDPCEDPLRSYCPSKDEFFLCPSRCRFYATVDGAAITRVPQRKFDFAALNTPDNIDLSTRDFEYDLRAAGRVLIGYTLNDCVQIEGVCFGVSESDDTKAVRDGTTNAFGGPGNLFSPFNGFGATTTNANPLGLDYNNLSQIRYTSSLQSVELNIRRQVPIQPERLAVSYLFGIRYFGLPEKLDYLTESVAPTPNAATNTVHVATENQMIGPQIGALFEIYVDNRWWINFEIKAAVLNDRGQQSTTYTNVTQGFSTSSFTSVREDHTAFAGDLDLTFLYRWSPHFSTRVGYQALFMADLVLAPDNFNSNIDILQNGPAQLNHRGSTIYHGPYAGITLGW